jgi:hypothetical protein
MLNENAIVNVVFLYDGGWRASDYEELKQEYGFTDEEAKQVCDQLAMIEEAVEEEE